MPASISGAAFSRERFQPVTLWPAAISRGTTTGVINLRYEGVDERVVEHLADDEISIGDYVLNGGEVAALVIIEAVTRLIPGVIGNPQSLDEESHSMSDGSLLEYPTYTKPSNWRGLEVPQVLLSGNHAEIAKWRSEQAKLRTKRLTED